MRYVLILLITLCSFCNSGSYDIDDDDENNSDDDDDDDDDNDKTQRSIAK